MPEIDGSGWGVLLNRYLQNRQRLMDVSTLRLAVDSGRDLIRFSMRAVTVHQPYFFQQSFNLN